MRKLHLYGDIGEEYGEVHELEVNSVGEALRAMNANYPGFTNKIKKNQAYQVCRGPILAEKEEDLTQTEQLNKDTLGMTFKQGDFHIAPVVEGSGKGKGWMAVVLGAALIVAGVVVYAYGNPALGGFMIQMGVGIALAGVATLLAPTPPGQGQSGDRPEENKSFLFNGTVNTMEQGGAVPIVHGKFGVGSVVISSAQQAEDI